MSLSLLHRVLLSLLPLTLLYVILSLATPGNALQGIDLENPMLDVTLTPVYGYLHGHSKDVFLCERVRVSGHSRFKVGSYASVLQVKVMTSAKLESKIHICFHRNASLELCHCKKTEWKALQKGLWSSSVSPYGERYVDVKYFGEFFGSFTVSVHEDIQQWRFFCLTLGFVSLLAAPVVSNWILFYYYALVVIIIIIILLIIILLFQGRKWFQKGNLIILCLLTGGLLLVSGAFILHHISMLVNSILVNFGLSEEIHNMANTFVLLVIAIVGAILGCWFVIQLVSKDGMAQFVKWKIYIIATVLILQSSLDSVLAVFALISSCVIRFLITSLNWGHPVGSSPLLQNAGQETTKHNSVWNGLKFLFGWSQSPVKGDDFAQIENNSPEEVPIVVAQIENNPPEEVPIVVARIENNSPEEVDEVDTLRRQINENASTFLSSENVSPTQSLTSPFYVAILNWYVDVSTGLRRNPFLARALALFDRLMLESYAYMGLGGENSRQAAATARELFA